MTAHATNLDLVALIVCWLHSGGSGLEKNDVLAEAYVGFPQAQTMASFPRAAFDVFDLDDMLTPEERELRHRVRAFAVSSFSRLPLLSSCGQSL